MLDLIVVKYSLTTSKVDYRDLNFTADRPSYVHIGNEYEYNFDGYSYF